MPKKRPAKLRHDVAEIAYRTMLEATGQAPKTLPPGERVEKSAEAVRRGAKGGKMGGKIRASRMSAKRRSAAARKAAEKRWAIVPEAE